MNREISPLLILAGTCLSTILFITPLTGGWYLAFPFSALAFSTGAALSSFKHARNGSGLLLLAGIGFLLGSLLSLRVERNRSAAFTGIRIENVTLFRGQILEDSRKSRGGLVIHNVGLLSVADEKKGISSQAKGKLLLFSKDERYYYAGEIISGECLIRDANQKSTNAIDFTGVLHASVSEGFYTKLPKIRAMINRELRNRIESLGYPISSLFLGFFLGISDDIPAEMSDGFRGTGTVHLLALSGLHVGIVYFLIVFIMKPFPWRILKYALGCLLVLFYLFLVGPRPSLIRATLTVIFSGLAVLLDRDRKPLNIIGIVLLVILITDPVSLHTLSFQLSFLAVTGILTLGRALYTRLETFIPALIGTPIAYSVGAQIATLPLIMYHFGCYYPAGVAATVLLVPLVTLYLWVGIFLLLLSLVTTGFLFVVGVRLLQLLYTLIFEINTYFSSFPSIDSSLAPFCLVAAALFAFYYCLRYFLVVRRRACRILRLQPQSTAHPGKLVN